MKTTTTKPGLRSYPIHERLAIWQGIHKKLLGNDTEYRQHFHTYLTTVVIFSCALWTFYLPFFGIQLCGPWVDLAIVLSLGVVMVYLAVWQLHFMSQRIGHYLQSNHDA
jgi:hypothetical protein